MASAAAGQLDARGQHVRGVVAGIDALQAIDAAGEQQRAHDEHERERGFDDEQRGAQAGAVSPAERPSSSFRAADTWPRLPRHAGSSPASSTVDRRRAAAGRDDASGDGHALEAREARRRDRRQRIQQQQRDEPSGAEAGGRERRMLNQHQAQQLRRGWRRAPRARPARGGAPRRAEQQVGDVGARDEQQQHDAGRDRD